MMMRKIASPMRKSMNMSKVASARIQTPMRSMTTARRVFTAPKAVFSARPSMQIHHRAAPQQMRSMTTVRHSTPVRPAMASMSQRLRCTVLPKASSLLVARPAAYTPIITVRKFSSALTRPTELLSKLSGNDPIETLQVLSAAKGKRLNAAEFRDALKKHWEAKTNLTPEQQAAKAYLEEIRYFDGMLEDFAPEKLGLTEMTPAADHIREHIKSLLDDVHTTAPPYHEDPVDPWFGTDEKPVRVPSIGHCRQFGSIQDEGQWHNISSYKKNTTVLDTAEQVILHDIKGPIYGYGHH